MPAFETPQPIFVTIDIGAGDVRLVAGDRTDTVVEVRPSDPGEARRCDRRRADPGRVRRRPAADPRPAPEAIQLAQRRRVGGGEHRAARRVAAERRRRDGRTARHRPARGEPVQDRAPAPSISTQAGGIQLQTGIGDITVGHASGAAEVSTGSGAVRIGAIDGTAVIKNSNGDTRIGDVSRRRTGARGQRRIAVEQAHAAVAAKTANGDIRLGEVRRGSVVAETALGKIEVGIGAGVAAWLDLHTQLRQRRQPPGCCRRAPNRARRPSRYARARPPATSRSAAASLSRSHRKERHDDHASPDGDQRRPAYASPSATTWCSTAST